MGSVLGMAKDKSGKKRKFDFRNLIFIGLAIYLLVLLFAQQGTLSRNKAVLDTYQEKIAAAQAENDKLKQEYDKIGTDEYIKEKARQSGLVRSDEIVFVTGNN